ncbi:MAG: excisionase [Vibrio sp.]
MKLTLQEWAQKEYSQPPSLNTLRNWAKTKQIYPHPKKHGAVWRVDENAQYVGLPDAQINSDNPLVQRIFKHGSQTTQIYN